MKYIKESYKKNSKIYNIMFFIISVSLSIGLIVSFCLNESLVKDIYDFFLNHLNNYNMNILNNILYSICTYVSLFLLTLTIIGVFIPFLSLFIENMSIGLLIGIIIQNSGLKGLLFGIIYFILTKALYLTILFYLIINFYKFIKELIYSLKNKNNNSIYSLYSKIILKILLCILFITFYNIIGIFIIPKIIKLFIFLL